MAGIRFHESKESIIGHIRQFLVRSEHHLLRWSRSQEGIWKLSSRLRARWISSDIPTKSLSHTSVASRVSSKMTTYVFPHSSVSKLRLQLNISDSLTDCCSLLLLKYTRLRAHSYTGKLASLNRSWQSIKGTFRALGMAGIEPMQSESG